MVRKMFYNRSSYCRSRTNITITDTNFYVPVVTLSTQDNAKLLEQFKSGFKRTINWNKYEPKATKLIFKFLN